MITLHFVRQIKALCRGGADDFRSLLKLLTEIIIKKVGVRECGREWLAV
jgi:hypothetical protein